jgi:hypothetical protein
MIIREKIRAMSAIISVLMAVVLSGCAGQSEPDVAKTINVNQSPTALNNNNAPVNPPNASTSAVNNISTPTVNSTPTVTKDKKPSPPVKDPTPQIGSSGGDMFLFTQARGALSSDQELINAVIIEIKEGNATLTGSVSSQAQKTKAGQLIKSVNGIKSVKNNLRVSS